MNEQEGRKYLICKFLTKNEQIGIKYHCVTITRKMECFMKPFKRRICLVFIKETITSKCGFSVNLIIWELLAASIYVKITLKKFIHYCAVHREEGRL